MSLATRCTACGTVFRVVQDQLKVSEGWVRCGRCSEVFNALEGLFDLTRETPLEAPIDLPPQVPRPAAGIDAALGDKIDAQLQRTPDEPGQAPAVSARDRLEFPDARFDTHLLSEPGSDVPPDEGAALTVAPDESALLDDDIEAASAEPAPEFVQRAQRQARWQSPTMRAAFGGAAALLIVGLALQVMHQQRDFIAARWPATAPALASWCEALSCTIAAPRRIEDVAVDSTALTQSTLPDAYHLAVVLRNRGAIPVAMPSLDLSLTDTTGQLVARKVLTPRDFRAAAAPIRPGTDASLQLEFSAGGARVTGYTVEVFYP
ncbi:zinc-ribbon and DUF3426 domain-containing protein [Rhizobacter sp. Root404]|uniref:zinc-ribbon and DUF3426 domain-containing protein n=1 Tax=Rhizobacter sp. Root404 TaxID=1736528 RepID=UPI0006FD8B17|nr:zinc-ribbon and DUF3426 domain-containing protein [Rhizobacter sp. Root404]KQW40186.1 hypothetical protein ASC76_01695 [Rhizobacter sp. Root404]